MRSIKTRNERRLVKHLVYFGIADGKSQKLKHILFYQQMEILEHEPKFAHRLKAQCNNRERQVISFCRFSVVHVLF